MKLITGLILFAVCVVASMHAKKCDCQPAAANETTRLGGNEWVVQKEAGVKRSIHGVVSMPLKELHDDLLVELFDQPYYLLCEWKPNNPDRCTTKPPDDQRRFAACRTGKDGKFCFDDLPAGTYELRISKSKEWSPTHVYVVVDPKDPKSTNTPIEVSLNIGI